MSNQKEIVSKMLLKKFQEIEMEIELNRVNKINGIEGHLSHLECCERILRDYNYFEEEYPELKHIFESLKEQLENKEFDYYRNKTKNTITRLFYKDGRINENVKITIPMNIKLRGYIRTFRKLDLENGEFWNDLYNTDDFDIEKLNDYVNNPII